MSYEASVPKRKYGHMPFWQNFEWRGKKLLGSPEMARWLTAESWFGYLPPRFVVSISESETSPPNALLSRTHLKSPPPYPKAETGWEVSKSNPHGRIMDPWERPSHWSPRLPPSGQILFPRTRYIPNLHVSFLHFKILD